MSRICEICEKSSQKGKKVTLIWGLKYRSIRHRQPNLINTTIMVDGIPTKVKICSTCLKSIKNNLYANVSQIPQYGKKDETKVETPVKKSASK